MTIYVRLSLDKTGEGLGVDRQESECRAFCESRGWDVREVLVDNDLSATTGVRRPSFEKLLKSKPTAVVVWHIDRLVRVSKDLELVVELGVNVHALQSGHVDLSTPAGRAVARTVTAWATYEGEQKSERQKSAARQRARSGKHWWPCRPFGLEMDGTLREDEAAALRQVYDGLLVGVSLRRLALDLNAAGFVTSPGGQWLPATLGLTLRNARNAGIRAYDGEEVGPGDWAAIVPEETYRAALRLLSMPGRNPSAGSPRSALLSGVAKCGKCGGAVRPSTRNLKGRPSYRIYVCGINGCTTHRLEFVDMVVTEEVVARLSRPDARQVFAGEDLGGIEEMRAKAVRLREKLIELRGDYDDDFMSRVEYRESSSLIRGRLEAAEAALEQAGSGRPLDGLLDAGDVREAWDALSVDRQRGVIQALVGRLVLHPRQRGQRALRATDLSIEFAEGPVVALDMPMAPTSK